MRVKVKTLTFSYFAIISHFYKGNICKFDINALVELFSLNTYNNAFMSTFNIRPQLNNRCTISVYYINSFERSRVCTQERSL